ncbi:MAG: alpha/beta hydrolase [Alkalibacterium sp.]|nr:alpha/beta hydrolase [Alkalibacterium sp.]
MNHIFKEGTDLNSYTLLLLHGTGGSENDLLPLAEEYDADANVLSVRGNVSENGMNRFFKRLQEGVFDIEDLKFRTQELNEFLDTAAEQYDFNRRKVIAVGYSNGANIAGSLLFHYNDALAGAILHHPMVPLREISLPNLSGIPVFIGAGTNDPICPPEESTELNDLLTDSGAEVMLHWESYGHQLTAPEVEAASKWFEENKNRLK